MADTPTTAQRQPTQTQSSSSQLKEQIQNSIRQLHLGGAAAGCHIHSNSINTASEHQQYKLQKSTREHTHLLKNSEQQQAEQNITERRPADGNRHLTKR
jgi:DNA replication protein DnaD